MATPQRETHYGLEVWVDLETEALRKEQCLCLRCENLGSNCTAADEFLALCITHGTALLMTRCPRWEPRLGGG